MPYDVREIYEDDRWDDAVSTAEGQQRARDAMFDTHLDSNARDRVAYTEMSSRGRKRARKAFHEVHVELNPEKWPILPGESKINAARFVAPYVKGEIDRAGDAVGQKVGETIDTIGALGKKFASEFEEAAASAGPAVERKVGQAKSFASEAYERTGNVVGDVLGVMMDGAQAIGGAVESVSDKIAKGVIEGERSTAKHGGSTPFGFAEERGRSGGLVPQTKVDEKAQNMISSLGGGGRT